jgi:hypothetical protein
MLATQDVYPSSTAHLTNDERRARLREKAYVIDMQLLSFAREAAEFAATDAWEEDGSTSPIDWLRFNCHLTSTVAADRIAVGEALHQLSASVAATMSGEIGFAHLKDMAMTADAVGRKFDETKLLEKARENSPGKFHYICHHYRHAADRKRFESEQAELMEIRKLSISKCEDGVVLVNGVLDPVGGAAFISAIVPLAQKSAAHDDRNLEQRQADAWSSLPRAVARKPRSRSRARSRLCSAWRVRLPRRWSSPFLFPRPPSSGWPATPASRASCSTPNPLLSMSGAPRGWFQSLRDVRWQLATATAGGQDAIGPRRGARRIT